MAIKNKDELTQAILASFTKPPVTDAGQAKDLARQTAEEIARAIDEYTHYQIGQRLEEILTAIAAESATSLPIPIIRGYNFDRFTRKTSS